MNHRAVTRFWECYRSLPGDVQSLADQANALMVADERHPSIQLKKVGQFWSARVGLHYRALAIQADDTLVWFWIGHHAEYDRLIRS